MDGGSDATYETPKATRSSQACQTTGPHYRGEVSRRIAYHAAPISQMLLVQRRMKTGLTTKPLVFGPLLSACFRALPGCGLRYHPAVSSEGMRSH